MNKNEWRLGIVVGGRLFCRKQAQKGADYFGRFYENEQILIREHDEEWFESLWQGNEKKRGFVMKRFVREIEGKNVDRGGKDSNLGNIKKSEKYDLAGFESGSLVKTCVDGVYIRKAPSKGADFYGRLCRGSTFLLEGIVLGGKIDKKTDEKSDEKNYEKTIKKECGNSFEKAGNGLKVKSDNSSNIKAYEKAGDINTAKNTAQKADERIDKSRLWACVKFGSADGRARKAYIHLSCIRSMGKAPDSALEKCLIIAKSLAGNHKSALGLNGDSCQNFIYWLCAAIGFAPKGMPFGKGFCGKARDSFKALRAWHSIGEKHTPRAGEIVYYGDRETPGRYTPSKHTGLVLEVNEEKGSFISVECNVSNRIRLCEGDYNSGLATRGTRHKIQGFASPDWEK